MNVYITGAATTKFGELWHVSPRDLMQEAVTTALADAEAEKKDIQALFVGNMLSGTLGGQEQLGAFFSDELGLTCAAAKIEGACASGGLAMHAGVTAILSGMYDAVLVLGVEKMTDYKPEDVAAALMGAGEDRERDAGATFPALYALIARAHMQAFGTTEEDMARVAVKNHYHASLNSHAHFTSPITLQQVLSSTKIASPLKLLDCSPISDGAAAVVLSRTPKGKRSVEIAASVVATDSLGLAGRSSLTSIASTKRAAHQAYAAAAIDPKDVQVAEVHDCFTIAEIIAMEDLMFIPEGEVSGALARQQTTLGGEGPIINTSGGLKASGHPVGATGVKQLVEVYQQLTGKAGKKQVKGARIGLTHNVGGSGATAVIHILKSPR